MPITKEQWVNVLDSIGVPTPSGSQLRHDAAYSAILAQQLQFIEAEVYRQLYPELKAKELFPVDSTTPSGAETTGYDMLTEFGAAALISNYADDLPLVDVMKERFVIKIQSYGDGYLYSIQDIRASQMSGMPLEQERANTARYVVEVKIEEVAAVGNKSAGIRGALNHPNVPLYVLPNGTWSSATANAIVEDLHSVVDQVLDANDDTVIPDTMVLAPASYRYAAERRYTDGSAETALSAFRKDNAYIKNVIPWNRCKTADAAGTGPRCMVYKRDRKVISLDIPQPFEQFPPQADNLAFKVPCHVRVAGIKIKYPLGCGYADGM
jgi:hypothetical protein